MRRSITASALPLAALLAALAVPAAPAGAVLLPKTWVSNAGVDSASCGFVNAPCATLQQAHDNALPGADIGVLTPGDYGKATGNALTISKSVHITNDGAGEATLLANDIFPAVIVQAGVGDIVGLRGLVIDGRFAAGGGIDIISGLAVHIQNCVVRNSEGTGSGQGIFAVPSNGRSLQLFVSDTIIYNNGGAAASGGIVIRPFLGSSVNVVLDRVHLEDNVRGLWADGTQTDTGDGVHVVMRDSVVSGNAGDGVIATSAAGKAPAFIVVERTSAANNAGAGLHADGPRAVIVLNDTTVTRNGAGIAATNSGQLLSFGNNKNFNNLGPEGAPTGMFGQM